MVFEPLKSNPVSLTVAFAATIIHAFSSLSAPLVAKRAVDDVIVKKNGSHLLVYLLLLFLIAIVGAVCIGVRKYEANRLAASLSEHYRDRLFGHLQMLPPGYHETMGTGQVLSRISSDVSKLEAVISNLHFNFLTVVVAIGAAVMLFLIQPLMALVVVVLLLLAIAVAARFSRTMVRISRTMQDRVGVLSEFVEEQINGIRVVKGHGLEEIQLARGDDLAAAVYETGIAMTSLRSRFAAGFSAIPSTASVIVLGIGGWFGLNGRLTPGGLVAFLYYLALLIATLPVVNEVVTVWPPAWASLDRITEVLEAQSQIAEPPSPVALPKGGGAIRFSNVTFGYTPKEPILGSFSLDIPAGSCLGITGLSGSGKSTLAQLLLRFRDVWSGDITIDGVGITTVPLRDLRAAISLVPAEPFVFSGTIRENICLGRPSATDEEIKIAAALACAGIFIDELEDQYETVVGERGMNLSGGQRQRLAIARALVRKPNILILDDATSSVEPSLELRILKAIREVSNGQTILVIANRKETLQFVDRVVLIDEGAIVNSETAEDASTGAGAA